jgi:hypothetical protein
MKTVRTLQLGYESYAIPETMTEKDLVIFLGTFATLQRIQSVHSKDYENAYSYVAASLAVSTGTATVYNSKELAQEDRDQYDTLKAEQAAQALA